jgi:hypothetical protein
MKNLHPSVELAEGVVVGTQELALFGELLTCGVANHKVKVMGFSVNDAGRQVIHARFRPLDRPEPLQFREA